MILRSHHRWRFSLCNTDTMFHCTQYSEIAPSQMSSRVRFYHVHWFWLSPVTVIIRIRHPMRFPFENCGTMNLLQFNEGHAQIWAFLVQLTVHRTSPLAYKSQVFKSTLHGWSTRLEFRSHFRLSLVHVPWLNQGLNPGFPVRRHVCYECGTNPLWRGRKLLVVFQDIRTNLIRLFWSGWKGLVTQW